MTDVRWTDLAEGEDRRPLKHGRMLLLKVRKMDCPTEDADVCRTIGFNDLDGTGDDEWRVVGWDWVHDGFVDWSGRVQDADVLAYAEIERQGAALSRIREATDV